MCSSTARSCSPRKLPQVWGITKMWVWASRHPRRPSKETTSIRNVPSPPTSAFVARSSRESSSPTKCTGPSSSEEITFTTSLNTTGTKRDTQTSLPIAHLPFKSRSVISPSSENADPSPKLFASTSSKWLPMKSSVTLENSSSSSDLICLNTYLIISLYNQLSSLHTTSLAHMSPLRSNGTPRKSNSPTAMITPQIARLFRAHVKLESL